MKIEVEEIEKRINELFELMIPFEDEIAVLNNKLITLREACKHENLKYDTVEDNISCKFEMTECEISDLNKEIIDEIKGVIRHLESYKK